MRNPRQNAVQRGRRPNSKDTYYENPEPSRSRLRETPNRKDTNYGKLQSTNAKTPQPAHAASEPYGPNGVKPPE